MERQSGIVYLVGAGPGDPELITVRGLRCLRQADVVIYDRLVSEALLDEAPPWAECIFVGKVPGAHVLSQTEINALLIERARAGQVVVRLKGGDPFVFGRGGEEAQALAAAGVPFEIVPGVTSAIGVPTCAGIPVTHRGLSSAFAVVTAHRADSNGKLNWEALAQIDTLVVLMGVGRLPDIVAALLRHGRSPDTPVAILERGTLPDERVVTGALHNIVERATQAGIRPPATIVIGEVVSLREYLTRCAPLFPAPASSLQRRAC
jgi:uroporphyrin-III C-methyltransferase